MKGFAPVTGLSAAQTVELQQELALLDPKSTDHADRIAELTTQLELAWQEHGGQVYAIDPGKLDALQRRLKTIDRHSQRLGDAGVRLREIERGELIVPHASGRGSTRTELLYVAVWGSAPRLKGCELVAACRELEDGTQVVQPLAPHLMSVEHVLAQQVRPKACDLCNVQRRRSWTYLLRKESGSYVQVGKTCLRDHFGINDPQRVARHANRLQDLTASLAASAPVADQEAVVWPLLEVMALAAACVRMHGYVSRRDASGPHKAATASALWQILHAKERAVPADEDVQAAMAARARMLSLDPGTSFVANCQRVCEQQWVGPADLGLLCAALAPPIAAAQRIDGSQSLAQGAKNDRLRNLQLTATAVIWQSSDSWGSVWRGIMQDDHGQLYQVTRRQSECDLIPGRRYAVWGTVAFHRPFGGGIVTALARSAVALNQSRSGKW